MNSDGKAIFIEVTPAAFYLSDQCRCVERERFGMTVPIGSVGDVARAIDKYLCVRRLYAAIIHLTGCGKKALSLRIIP